MFRTKRRLDNSEKKKTCSWFTDTYVKAHGKTSAKNSVQIRIEKLRTKTSCSIWASIMHYCFTIGLIFFNPRLDYNRNEHNALIKAWIPKRDHYFVTATYPWQNMKFGWFWDMSVTPGCPWNPWLGSLWYFFAEKLVSRMTDRIDGNHPHLLVAWGGVK